MVRRGDDTDRTRYCAAAVDCAGNGASAVPERAPGTLAATPLPRRALPAPRPQFQHVFGGQLTPPPAGDAFDDALITFDQDGYAGAVWPALASYGFAYVPPACAEGAPCRLHVALHGCGQSAWRETAAAQDSTSRELGAGWARPPVGARARSSCAHQAAACLHALAARRRPPLVRRSHAPTTGAVLPGVGQGYARHAGFNQWARLNRIAVLYPQGGGFAERNETAPTAQLQAGCLCVAHARARRRAGRSARIGGAGSAAPHPPPSDHPLRCCHHTSAQRRLRADGGRLRVHRGAADGGDPSHDRRRRRRCVRVRGERMIDVVRAGAPLALDAGERSPARWPPSGCLPVIRCNCSRSWRGPSLPSTHRWRRRLSPFEHCRGHVGFGACRPSLPQAAGHVSAAALVARLRCASVDEKA